MSLLTLFDLGLGSSPLPKYDLFFSGNISIKKNKIFFSSYNSLLLYNSWSSDKNNKNDARDVNLFSSIKNWVDIHFKNYNKGNPKILYHPTVLMQIGYKNYIFVLKNASYDENRKYKLIFNISTKQINSKSSNIRKKIPEGKFKRVRFDVDSFDKKNGNLINNLVPRIVYDGNHFKNEQNHYNSNIKLSNNPDLLVSRNVKKRGFPTEFTINSQIEIWDQGAVGDCAAEATCFLYTYIMAFKDVDFTNKKTLRPLTDKIVKDILVNTLLFRTRYDDPNCFFSRFFIMWAGYHTPIGSYDYNINVTYGSNTLPTASSGSYILNNFIGLQSWGGIPLLSNNIEFTSKQDYSAVMNSATKYAFDGKNLTRGEVDALTKNELDVKISNFNDTTSSSDYSSNKINPYWSIQKNNNFKIYTVKQEEDAIISVLSNGYPITVSMTIINIGLNNNTIGLVVEDGLIDVLQYTEYSQTVNNIKPGCHAVVAIGYIKNSINNSYYVKIRNSWGLGFGTFGCFYMPMSFLVDTRYCTSLYTIGLSSDIPSLYFVDTTLSYYIYNKTKVFDLTEYVRASRTNIGITYEISAVDSSSTTATLKKEKNGTNLTINSNSDGFCTITAKQGTENPCIDTFPEQNCYLESSITFKWEQASSQEQICADYANGDDDKYWNCMEGIG
jgi:hypothetical protein